MLLPLLGLRLRAAFATTDEWTVVRIPFSALRSSIVARTIPTFACTVLDAGALAACDDRHTRFIGQERHTTPPTANPHTDPRL